MKMRKRAIGLGALLALAIATHADAYEFGSGGWLQKPGLVIGAAAAAWCFLNRRYRLAEARSLRNLP